MLTVDKTPTSARTFQRMPMSENFNTLDLSQKTFARGRTLYLPAQSGSLLCGAQSSF
jgi:hypothetical protein